MFCYYKNLDENLAWLTQMIEELKCNQNIFTPPTPLPLTHTHTVNATELQSNKKVGALHFYINPIFMVILLSSKILVPQPK